MLDDAQWQPDPLHHSKGTQPTSSHKQVDPGTTTLNAHPTPQWVNNAIFYEIYPQSFYDSNNDGIGDIQGIIAKLDYVASLGCNALWINPCFDSPFKDAGYDVRNYCRVAARYGTNSDLIRLFDEAHQRDMHVLLDLVPGHTSEEHDWFLHSKQAEHNAYSERYIWTDSAFQGYSMPFIGGESERDGVYILNYFKCQPALNYGFAQRDQPWQKGTDSPEAQATRDAMVNVMTYWLERGCDGFRVDMANSLVKNDDEGKSATIAAWQYMLGKVKAQYPHSAFVSEWGVPEQAFAAGFDMDFYLDWRWDGKPNGYNMLARNLDASLKHPVDDSYFCSSSTAGIQPFLNEYLPQYEATRGKGQFCFITCNHDTPRLAPRLSERELRVAYGMLLTMPGVPFLYYGDEIGMRYRTLPTKEGGYTRTGSRTPMQWKNGTNLGFSQAPSANLYLPVEDAGDAPTVASQSQQSDSLLNWIRMILRIRSTQAALQASAGFEVLAAPQDGRSFVYRRTAQSRVNTENASSSIVVALNPGTTSQTVRIDAKRHSARAHAPLCQLGDVAWKSNHIDLGPQSFAIFE